MSDLRIVACGGGNPVASARPHFDAALELTGTSTPNLLIIPTAKTTQTNYDLICNRIRTLGIERGLHVRTLHDFGTLPSLRRAIALLAWADIVYVTGGDTERAIKTWQGWTADDQNFAAVFTDMAKTGAFVGFGIRAGLLAWFGEGFSDSDSYRVPEGAEWHYRPVECLGLFPGILADAHHDSAPEGMEPRETYFRREMLRRPPGSLGLGVESGAALRILGRGTEECTVDFLGAPGAGGTLVHRYFTLGRDEDLGVSTYDPGVGRMRLAELIM